MTQPPLALTASGVPPLRLAFDRSTLAGQGFTYEKALAVPLIRQALECHARAITNPNRKHA